MIDALRPGLTRHKPVFAANVKEDGRIGFLQHRPEPIHGRIGWRDIAGRNRARQHERPSPRFDHALRFGYRHVEVMGIEQRGRTQPIWIGFAKPEDEIVPVAHRCQTQIALGKGCLDARSEIKARKPP